MSTEPLSSWHEVIKTYIDELNDEGKKDQFVNELLSSFYSDSLAKASTDNEQEQKELSKLVATAKKISTSANSRVKFEALYSTFRSKEWVEDLTEKIKFIETKKNFYNIWICRSVMIGDGVVPGTHIAKLTHSSSAGSSFLDRSIRRKSEYLTTSSLSDEIIDGTYPNAKLSKQVKFLMLEYGGVALFDELLKGNDSVLAGFETTPEELKVWGGRYREMLSKKPSSDFLLKQIYFPVENDYHLLTVVRSSSLSQKIYLDYFSKEARKLSDSVNKARKTEKYSSETSKQVLGICKIAPTRSQSQNVSVMLGKIGSRIRLFSAQPPVWRHQKKPPVRKTSWFYENSIYRATKEDIDFLRDFLIRFNHLDLSTRDPKRREWMVKWVNRIISNVLFFAEDAQNLTPGWSDDPKSKLKVEQQYFLDPYRSDEAFQVARKATDWSPVVCADFAAWLNNQLKGKDKKFTPQAEHTKLWKSLMEKALRDSNQVVEAVLAAQDEEIV